MKFGTYVVHTTLIRLWYRANTKFNLFSPKNVVKKWVSKMHGDCQFRTTHIQECGHGVPVAKIRLGTPCPSVPAGNEPWSEDQWLQVSLNCSGPGMCRASSSLFPISWRVIDGGMNWAHNDSFPGQHALYRLWPNKRRRLELMVFDSGGHACATPHCCVGHVLTVA